MAHPPELDLDIIRARAEQENNDSASGIPRPTSPSTDAVIVRADEVDEVPEDRPQRPILRREGSAPPPPPRQPPPPAPQAQEDGQSESLSVAQLRNIATNLPKLEPKAYAYSYDETRTFPEELEEWFQYTEYERGLWEASKGAYDEGFASFEDMEERGAGAGLDPSSGCNERFVTQQLEILEGTDPESRRQALLAITYMAMGSWARLDSRSDSVPEEDASDFAPPNGKYRRANVQLWSIQAASILLCRAGAVKVLFKIVRKICDQ